MSFDDFATPNHNYSLSANMQHEAAAAEGFQTGLSTVTQTVTKSVRQKFSKLKTLLLKLKPSSRQPDLSSLDSNQLNSFVDEMIGDLQNTFTHNINDLRERIKNARPDPTDSNYAIKMQLYQELLSTMVPIIQKIQALAGDILNELHALINQLWDDICKNNGKQVDRLLEEHAQRTEMQINKTFLEPLDILEAKLKQIKQNHSE